MILVYKFVFLLSMFSKKNSVVVKSYVLGEIPSLKDRITVVRQLWDLTDDLLVCLWVFSSFILLNDFFLY